jgi:hypothetical protein
MLALRRPAPADYLVRRIGGIDWRGGGRDGPPCEGSRWWLVETCRAELDWAWAQWRRLDPGAGIDDLGSRERCWAGSHPAETWRLPHEHEAARLVNAHLHLELANARARELLRRLPGQRQAAADASQGAAYRACWRQRAAACEGELRAILVRRHHAWRAFLQAAAQYRRLRATMAPLSAAA